MFQCEKDLHSSMDRYKEVFIHTVILSEIYLHSSMDRYKE